MLSRWVVFIRLCRLIVCRLLVIVWYMNGRVMVK